MRLAALLKRTRALHARFSLRVNLVLLLILAAAALIADRGRELTLLRSEEIARAQAEAIERAREGAERQSDVIAEAKTLLQMAAELPMTAADAGSACQDPFRRIYDKVPWLTSIAVLGLDGFPLCSSAHQVVPRSFADRSYFREALATGDFALSDYIVGRITGRPVIVVAVPRMRDGVAETVLITAIDLDWMSRIAADIGSGLGAEVLLLDKQHTVLASSHDPQSWLGRNLSGQSDFVGALAAATPRGPVELDGRARIVGHAKLADTDAILAVMIPLETVLADANRQASYHIGKIMLLGVLSFLVIWLGGELLVVRPVESLTQGAERIGSGDLGARIETERLAPELRRLGESFNAMAERLREREADLRQANLRLSDLASKDALTGIANRRGFDERFAAEWNRALRVGDGLALLVVDVDHFKKFNDHYGHIQGDACLRKVAEVLRCTAQRGGDFAARTGGEEFVLLLPGADLDAAARLAESVRAQVETLSIPHKASPEARVTVSVGAAATRPGQSGSPRRLADLADAALYRAKRAGRNRVVLDQPAVSLAS